MSQASPKSCHYHQRNLRDLCVFSVVWHFRTETSPFKLKCETLFFSNRSCDYHIFIRLYHLWLKKISRDLWQKSQDLATLYAVISHKYKYVFPTGGISVRTYCCRYGVQWVPMQSTQHFPGSGTAGFQHGKCILSFVSKNEFSFKRK